VSTIASRGTKESRRTLDKGMAGPDTKTVNHKGIKGLVILSNVGIATMLLIT
jgi:hypothetical protein